MTDWADEKADEIVAGIAISDWPRDICSNKKSAKNAIAQALRDAYQKGQTDKLAEIESFKEENMR